MQHQNELDQFDAMSVGEILRRAREYYGRSLSYVATNLRIRESYIAALEEDRIEDLPGKVYAIGFVRSYAEFLDLDANKIVYLFKKQKPGVRERASIQMNVDMTEHNLPEWWMVLVSGVGLILIWAVLTGTPKIEERSIPEAPPTTLETAIDTEKTLQNTIEKPN